MDSYNYMDSLMESFTEDTSIIKKDNLRFEYLDSDYQKDIYYYGFYYPFFGDDDWKIEPELILDFTDADLEINSNETEDNSPIAKDCDDPKVGYRIYDKEVDEQEFIKSFINAAKESEFKFEFTEDDVKNFIKKAVEDSKTQFLTFINSDRTIWDYLDRDSMRYSW